ncbi:nickel-dependent lactate racemase [Hydrogenispora ethanolica]|uniref:Nickel-dependent lactate racemase n=1 Tax=Hydrogenispora ethanolica TaxID=1082276 RepID=A0A4R1RBZ1_HYDET|nr:nickel-dependent lactate racemase [Hydrogenispora ethanolica]TCL63331.1 nickel-dependent lactate racemase [Hydrogenispora ethanolica]
MKLAFGNEMIDLAALKSETARVRVLAPDEAALRHQSELEQTAAVKQSLTRPIAGYSLSEWFRNGKNLRLAIIIPDVTRNCSTPIYLRVLLKELENLGAKAQDTTIVVAVGNHRHCTEAELERLVGEDIYARYAVVNHLSRENLVDLGTTPSGNRILMNRDIVRADKVLVTGNITYHNFAGFSGGRKSILPGVSGSETILNNHRLMLKGDRMHEKCQIGILAGNPIHEDMLHAVGLLDPRQDKLYCLNVVTNMFGQILTAFCGRLAPVFEAGVAFAESKYKIEVPARGNIVLCSAGGFPYDINFYQSFKSLYSGSKITAPGGYLFLLAECRDGLGDTEEKFKFWFSKNQSEIIQELYHQFDVVGQIAYWTKDAQRNFKLFVVTHPANFAQLQSLGLTTIGQETLEQQLNKALAESGESHIYLAPYANITYLGVNEPAF